MVALGRNVGKDSIKTDFFEKSFNVSCISVPSQERFVAQDAEVVRTTCFQHLRETKAEVAGSSSHTRLTLIAFRQSIRGVVSYQLTFQVGFSNHGCGKYCLLIAVLFYIAQ